MLIYDPRPFCLPHAKEQRRYAFPLRLCVRLLFIGVRFATTSYPLHPPPGFLLRLNLMFSAIFIANGMAVYSRKYMKEFNAYDVASIRMWAAALTVLPLSIFLIGLNFESVTTTDYMGLLYAAVIGTFAGLLLAFYNIKRFGATAAAMTAYVIPIVAGIGSVLFLDEQITAVMLIGMALIILGIAILQSNKSKFASEVPVDNC